MLFVNQVMRVWPAYYNAPAINGRPCRRSVTGRRTSAGTSGCTTLDQFMHLLLPTLALVLIGFAAYTRYSRSSMLEVMSQDYIRTARSKGLPERTVIMRHGFRNSLIPLATVVPIDVITLLGGAIITEKVFARPGMGTLFLFSLTARGDRAGDGLPGDRRGARDHRQHRRRPHLRGSRPQDPGERMSTIEQLPPEDSTENAIELREVAGLSQGQIVRRRFLRHRGAMVAVVVLSFVVILAFTSVGIGGWTGWWRFTPNEINPVVNGGKPDAPARRPGSVATPACGSTGACTRSARTRSVATCSPASCAARRRPSIITATVGISATVVGIVVGALAGFNRGRTDDILMRITDLVITMPVIVIGAVLGQLAGGNNPRHLRDRSSA